MVKFDKIIKVASSDYSSIHDISKKIGISELTAKVLINRGLNSVEECEKFLNPSIDFFLDPFLLEDIDIAVNRIIKAIQERQKIWIYGDYDVDGVTSTSILKNFFSQLNTEVEYYIPDRLTEGYGLNKEAINFINGMGGQLIITVDCGINSVDVVEYCNELGIDIIITDHHQCGGILPNALAVINPNRKDSSYPFKKLAGVGVTLKLIQALGKRLVVNIDYKEILPIAAIGTVADVVSLTGENRVIVKNGLELIRDCNNIGLKALIEISGLKEKKITSGHIGFILGPRINATGRIGLAKDAVELFTTKNSDKAYKLAKKLANENIKRQKLEEEILKEAEEIISKDIDLKKEKIIVVASEEWHPGVVGIVSSRITEKYYRPSIVISIEDSIGKGSARSISNFNIYDALFMCKELFTNFGGHKQAAGLSIEKDKISVFRSKINDIADNLLKDEDLIPEITVDSTIDISDISLETVYELNKLEPFGVDNPSPLFLCKKAKVKSLRKVGKNNNHLKFLIEKNDIKIECIGFSMGSGFDLADEDEVDLVVSVDINEFNNKKNVQFNVKEMNKVLNSNNLIMDNYFISLKNYLIREYCNEDEKKDVNFLVNRSEDRLKYTMNILQNNNPTIVLVNGYKNYIEIIGEMRAKGRDLLKKTTIAFNKDVSDKFNVIVVNPILENMSFQKYDDIVLYDMMYNVGDMKKLITEVKDSKLHILTIEEDVYENIQIIGKILPSINELRTIYKTFINRGMSIFKIEIDKYLKYLFKNTKIILNKYKFELSLSILKEGNLLDYMIQDNNCFIKMYEKPNKRIEIEKLPKYNTIKQIKENLNKHVKAL